MPVGILTSKLGFNMLVKFRQYVVENIKAPLQSAIETSNIPKTISTLKLVTKRLVTLVSPVDRETVTSPMIYALLDIKDKFFTLYHNKSKLKMFDSAWTMFIGEMDSDPHYRWLYCWLTEEQIMAILDGTWEVRPENIPIVKNEWSETKPYGGQYSIIWTLIKHREEIKKWHKDEVDKLVSTNNITGG